MATLGTKWTGGSQEARPTRPVVQEKPEPVAPTGPYSADDLTQSGYIEPIREYMEQRFGVDELVDKSDEEVTQWYLNNMRGFNAGNSTRAFNELAYLNKATDGQLSTAGRAYEIFNNMEGVFSGETTAGEKAGAVLDYTRSTLLDPVNVLGFGVGKAAGAAGTKGAATIAQQAAIRAFKKRTAAEIAKGATREAAEAAAKKYATDVGRRAGQMAASKNLRNVVAQRTINETTKGRILSRVASKQGARELLATVGVDSAAAAGADYAWQNGMIMTDNQEEYDEFQTGLAVLGSAVLSGVIQSWSMGTRGTAGYVLPSEDIKVPKRSIEVISSELKTRLQNWQRKVEAGRNLDDISVDEMKKLLLDDDGLITTIINNGWQDKWLQKNSYENVTDFVSHIFQEMDAQNANEWLLDFKEAFGLKKQPTATEIGKTLAYKLHDAGEVFSVMSQASKRLGKRVEDLTVDDLARAKFEYTSKMQKFTDRYLNKGFVNFQNNVIRSLVSNLATTSLNVAGWVSSSVLNTLTDFNYALLNGGGSILSRVVGDHARASQRALIARSFVESNRTKLRHLMDPQTSIERFRSIVSKHEGMMRELANVKNGGIEMPTLDPTKTRLGQNMDKAVDYVQMLNLVDAQDVATKAIEFQSQFDKYLYRAYGQTSDEFWSRPDAYKLMRDDKYQEAVHAATYETLRSIYSKSMKDSGLLGEVAGAIEDVRKLPGVGLLLPFGRFFNNTIAVMAEMVPGLSNLAKASAGKYASRTHGELVTRSATMMGLAASLAPFEAEWLDQGLNWDEARDPSTGAVKEYTWAYPAPLYKAAARLMAYKFIKQEDAPPEVITQIVDNLGGQLTRQLQDTVDGMGAFFASLLVGDLEESKRIFGDKLARIPSQYAAGLTRPIDPLNQAVGLFVEGEEFQTPDRRITNPEFGVFGRAINDSTRYIDNIFGLLEETPERVDAVEGPGRAQIDKYAGFDRENIAPTPLERAMNMVGITGFERQGGLKPRSYSDFNMADNKFNKLFYDIANQMAKRLIKREDFREGKTIRGVLSPYETRKKMLQNVLKEARDMTEIAMVGTANGYVERKQLEIWRNPRYSRKDINRAIERIETDTGRQIDKNDMDASDLVILELYLKDYERELDRIR